MYSENFSSPLKDLNEGKINYTKFLELTGNTDSYRKWCREHAMKPCEDNAELFFDMHGFAESETVKEYMEPVI